MLYQYTSLIGALWPGVPVALADPIKPVKAPDASKYPKTPAVPPIL
jgi:hypothetical protein